MYEHLLRELPESARVCRLLYDAPSGGYRIPPRHENRPLTLDDVTTCEATCTQVQYDCIEAPVADLLYALVVNTGSRDILETGTSRGFSTCHLAAAARFDGGAARARVVTIDLQPTAHPFFEGSALASTVRAVQADSLTLDTAGLVDADHDGFDFMFFDSLHTYAHLSAELVRYLPLLRLGGLFALHDTFVYDDLGLVVLATMRHACVEAVSLPTHRRHVEGLRSPGVSIFRKVAPIAAGDLRYPDLAGIVEGERQALVNAQAVVQRTGNLFGDVRYTAFDMGETGRTEHSPALLDARGSESRLARQARDAAAARASG